jgi:hypothetical protein
VLWFNTGTGLDLDNKTIYGTETYWPYNKNVWKKYR